MKLDIDEILPYVEQYLSYHTIYLSPDALELLQNGQNIYVSLVCVLH